jgi:hypothetical protein
METLRDRRVGQALVKRELDYLSLVFREIPKCARQQARAIRSENFVIYRNRGKIRFFDRYLSGKMSLGRF